MIMRKLGKKLLKGTLELIAYTLIFLIVLAIVGK